MTWLNDQETLTKCDACGKFIAVGEAYYAKKGGYFAYPFCDESCADKGAEDES